MIYDQLLRSIQSNQQDYAELDSRLSSGKKILAPSDDVIGAGRAMDYRVDISRNSQYNTNITAATSNLNLTNTILSSLYASVSAVKNLAETGMSGDPTSVSVSSQQAALLRDHLYGIVNTNIGGRYLFSGFRTNQQPYTVSTSIVGGTTVANYTYQGDDGVINVPIDRGAAMPINVTGSQVLSLNLAAPYTHQIGSGLNVHYTPVAGTTTVNVEIRDASDTTVLDTFSFSNAMEMADVLSTAIGTNNTTRIEALVDPLDKLQNQIGQVQSDVGTRLSSLQDQTSMLNKNTNVLQNVLSTIEDADPAETAMQLQKTSTALQALLTSASKVLSQSLLDFLQ